MISLTHGVGVACQAPTVQPSLVPHLSETLATLRAFFQTPTQYAAPLSVTVDYRDYFLGVFEKLKASWTASASSGELVPDFQTVADRWRRLSQGLQDLNERCHTFAGMHSASVLLHHLHGQRLAIERERLRLQTVLATDWNARMLARKQGLHQTVHLRRLYKPRCVPT